MASIEGGARCCLTPASTPAPTSAQGTATTARTRARARPCNRSPAPFLCSRNRSADGPGFPRRRRSSGHLAPACPHTAGRLRGALRTAFRAGLQLIADRESPVQELRGWNFFCLAPRMLLHRSGGDSLIPPAEPDRRCDLFARGAWLELLSAGSAASRPRSAVPQDDSLLAPPVPQPLSTLANFRPPAAQLLQNHLGVRPCLPGGHAQCPAPSP